MRATTAPVALLLGTLLLAGCGGAPGASSLPTIGPATLPAATAGPPSAEPTAAASPTEVPNTVYTADDEEIAKLIQAGADEAIPQLELLSDMDAEELTDLFLPLAAWITAQKAGLDPFTASSCTSSAVALFIKGMDRYDDIREKFLAWREWGAVGHAFPIGAPGQAITTFEEALAELEAHCPA